MPFQIYDGRTHQKRLILVEPKRTDRARVILEDGREVTVMPAGQLVNGYPGMRPQLDTLPKPIHRAYQLQIRDAMRRVETLRSQSEIVRRSALSDRFDEQIGDIKSQPLLCANIAIGRPLLLVLPSGMFTSRNRFSLPAVTELVVPV